MASPIKWAAKVANVQEVSLLGSADLAFWTNYLRAEKLVPMEREGRAQILVVAAEMKFMGIQFREISFSVLVRPPDNFDTSDAAFLVHAFNSNWFFAFSERVFFSTPYGHANVHISHSVPCSIRLQMSGAVVFRAEMQATTSSHERPPARTGMECWEGPIFLPNKRPGSEGKMFIGHLRGDTRTYRFQPDDILSVIAIQDHSIFQSLVDSRFAVEQWMIRDGAAHAKSKTYSRSENLIVH